MEISPSEEVDHISKYQCTRCNTTCETISKLNLHTNLYHEDLKPYKCANCAVCYEREEEVLSHIVMCSKALSFKCARCMTEFDNDDDLNKHNSLAHPYQCPDCDNSFVLKSYLNKHAKLCHIISIPAKAYGRVQCPLCSSDFASKSKLLRHHSGVHLKLKPYKCVQCDAAFSQQATLNKHNRDHHDGSYQQTDKKKRKRLSYASLDIIMDSASNSKASKKEKTRTLSNAGINSGDKRSPKVKNIKLSVSKPNTESTKSSCDSSYSTDDKITDLKTSSDFQVVNNSVRKTLQSPIKSRTRKHRSLKNAVINTPGDNVNLNIQELVNISSEPKSSSGTSGKPSPLSLASFEGLPSNECFLCNKVYSQRSSLYRHLRDVHSYDTNGIQDSPIKNENIAFEKIQSNKSLNSDNLKTEYNPGDLLQITPKNIAMLSLDIHGSNATKDNKVDLGFFDTETIMSTSENSIIHSSRHKKTILNEATCNGYNGNVSSVEQSVSNRSKNHEQNEGNGALSSFLVKNIPSDTIQIQSIKATIPLGTSEDIKSVGNSAKIECDSQNSMPISNIASNIEFVDVNCEESKSNDQSEKTISSPPEANSGDLNDVGSQLESGGLLATALKEQALFVESSCVAEQIKSYETPEIIRTEERIEQIHVESSTQKEQLPRNELLLKSVELDASKGISQTKSVDSVQNFEFPESQNLSRTAESTSQLKNNIQDSLHENNNDFTFSSKPLVITENDPTIISKKLKCVSRTEMTEDVFHIKSDEEDESDLKQQINEIYLSLGENEGDENSKSKSENLIQNSKKCDHKINSTKKRIQKSLEKSDNVEKSVECASNLPASDIPDTEINNTFNRRTSKRLLSLNSSDIKKKSDKKLRSSRSLSFDAEHEFLSKPNISLPLERTEEEEQFLYLKNIAQLKANEKIVLPDSDIEKVSPPKLRGRPSKRKCTETSFENPPKKRSKPDDFVEGTFRCMECHAMFYKKKDFEAHMDNAHRDTRPYRCEKCSACFKNDKALEIHDAAVHEKLKPHTCPKCGTGFGQRASLYRHMKEVIHDLIYCSDCNACFNVKKDLAEHINAFHSTLKPFKCDQCERSFVSKHQLAIHTATVHEKRRPYKCEQCGAAFGQRGSLHRHLKTVDHKILPFSCSFCSGKFRRKEDLKKHIDAEHKKHELDHKKCSIFKCSFCDVTFKLGKMLDYHIKAVHSAVTSNEQSSNNFVCLDCNELFPSESVLKLHMRSTHRKSKINDLQCINCQKLFTKKKFFKRHMDHASFNASSLKCLLCNVQFCEQIQLSTHNNDFHHEPEISETLLNDVIIKDEQLEEFNETEQNSSVGSLGNLNVAINVEQNLVNIDSIRDKHNKRVKSFEKIIDANSMCENESNTIICDQQSGDFMSQGVAINYSSPEKNINVLNSTKEILKDPYEVVNLDNFKMLSKPNECLLTTKIEKENHGNKIIDNAYQVPKRKETCEVVSNMAICSGSHEPLVSSPRETCSPILTKHDNLVDEKNTYLKEHHVDEGIIYTHPQNDNSKFIREYYKGESEAYIRNPGYSLPAEQHNSHPICYASDDHLNSISDYEGATVNYAESRSHLDNFQKPIDASCKNYDNNSYLSTQTNNSIHYVQAKPRSTIVTFENSKQISSLQTEAFDGSRRNYEDIEYTSSPSHMNESTKYVRAEYATKSISLTESDKFLRMDCHAATSSAIHSNTQIPIDASCKVYPNDNYASIPSQMHQSMKFLDKVNAQQRPRSSNLLENSHSSIEYETVQKPINTSCKTYIHTEYITTSSLSDQSLKYTDSSAKLVDSSCKGYLHPSSGYITTNSVIQPIKYIEEVQIPIDASRKNYSDNIIPLRHLEQENLCESVKYVPTIQKSVDAKSYISMHYEDQTNNLSQPIKYMAPLLPTIEDTVKTYVSSEHSRISINPHGDIMSKDYANSKYPEASQHLPVSESVKYIEGMPKQGDIIQKSATYVRPEYYVVPVSIGDTQYLVRHSDTPMQSYGGDNSSYTVPINVEEVSTSKGSSLETLYAHYEGKDLSNPQYAIFIDDNHEFNGKHSDAIGKITDIPGKATDETNPTSHYALTLHLMEALEKHVGASNKCPQLKAYNNENEESYGIEEAQFPTTSHDKQITMDSTKHFIVDELDRRTPVIDVNVAKGIERGTIVRAKYGNIVTLKADNDLSEENSEIATQVLDCTTDNVVILKESINSSEHSLPSTQIFKLKYPDQENINASALNLKDESIIHDYGTHFYIQSYLCTECNTLFNTREGLEQHLSTDHQNDMP